MAGVFRALGRASDAAHLAHLSTAIRRVLDHQPRTPWSLLRRALEAQGLLTGRDSELLERLRRADHDEIAQLYRRLPAGARALIRHGQHPLRHRVADEDVLLDADLERHLTTDLVDTLLPDSPEDALVPLGPRVDAGQAGPQGTRGRRRRARCVARRRAASAAPTP